jgi:acyl dehydratase
MSGGTAQAAPTEAPPTADRLTVPAFYFEDLAVGMSFLSAGRTVTEADIVAFAGLSGDYNQLHVNSEFAGRSVHGGRIAHGLLVLSILSGLSTRVPLMQALNETMVGLAGLECRWKKATKIGDTLHVRLTVLELKETSKKDNGLVIMRREAVNQHEEVVLESIWTLLIRCRHGGAV